MSKSIEKVGICFTLTRKFAIFKKDAHTVL